MALLTEDEKKKRAGAGTTQAAGQTGGTASTMPPPPRESMAAQTGTQTGSQATSQVRGLASGLPYKDKVGDIAADMMGKDSRLMKKAGAQGMQYANRRGLLNSSIGAQASQSAMLDHIVPMASQTAQQGHSKNLQHSEQEFRGGESEKDRALRLDIVEREETLQRDKMDLEAEQKALDRDLELSLENLKVTGNDRRGAESMLNNAFRDFEESKRSILNNPDLPSEERDKLLGDAKNMLTAKVNYVNALYDATFDWPANPWAPPADSGGSGGGGDSGSGDSGGSGGGELEAELDADSGQFWWERDSGK